MTDIPVSGSPPLEPSESPGRYHIPDTVPAGPADPVLIQVLEALNSHSQLLIDLLAAVNGLTSILLCRER